MTGKSAAVAAALLSRGGGNAKAGGGSSSAATSRMDFDAVRRELFVPADSPVWPFPVRGDPSLPPSTCFLLEWISKTYLPSECPGKKVVSVSLAAASLHHVVIVLLHLKLEHASTSGLSF